MYVALEERGSYLELEKSKMESKVMENVTGSTVNLAHLTDQVAKAKEMVNDVLENGQHQVKRTVKRAVVSAEDCIEDTTHLIKRHPWQSVGVAVGIGTLVGVFAGWQAGRCCERFYQR